MHAVYLKEQKGRKFADDFLQAFGATAILGYTKDVEWMDSMIIDLLFLQRFYNDSDPWKHLNDIFDSIGEDYNPAEKFGQYNVHKISRNSFLL